MRTPDETKTLIREVESLLEYLDKKNLNPALKICVLKTAASALEHEIQATALTHTLHNIMVKK